MVKLLKNLYDEKYIQILTNNIASNYHDFDARNFTKHIFDILWDTKELKQRMRHIVTMLYKFLPQAYDESITILQATFLKMNDKYMLENMIFQDFVEVYGIEHFTTSMKALACFTVQSSSEFAIRQFILKYPDETMAQMKVWARSENEHIRRLSSEGCRPRLPWAIALPSFKKNPQDVLSILDILKNDTSKYVRKSVANNINDISKDNPHIVKDIAHAWIGTNANVDWILKHGCRTLLKKGDKEILNIFGFASNENIQIAHFSVKEEVQMGERLEFSFVLQSTQSLGNLRIEYAMTFVRKNNKFSTKVFKISEKFHDKARCKIEKYYSFKALSTRKYYRGIHKIAIIINGAMLGENEFVLV